MAYYVYIMASRPNGTLYIGMTNDLVRRVYEHKEGLADGVTKRYGVKTLVYFETHDRAEQAIQREKTLKHWVRDWKIALIENDNAYWDDLYEHLNG
jgi:putative endonuclease